MWISASTVDGVTLSAAITMNEPDEVLPGRRAAMVLDQ